MLALLPSFAFKYLSSALCYRKTALFSANQNRVNFFMNIISQLTQTCFNVVLLLMRKSPNGNQRKLSLGLVLYWILMKVQSVCLLLSAESLRSRVTLVLC